MANSYGLFANMTPKREELTVEGSADPYAREGTWRAYAFRYKPGAPGAHAMQLPGEKPLQPLRTAPMAHAAHATHELSAAACALGHTGSAREAMAEPSKAAMKKQKLAEEAAAAAAKAKPDEEARVAALLRLAADKQAQADEQAERAEGPEAALPRPAQQHEHPQTARCLSLRARHIAFVVGFLVVGGCGGVGIQRDGLAPMRFHKGLCIPDNAQDPQILRSRSQARYYHIVGGGGV